MILMMEEINENATHFLKTDKVPHCPKLKMYYQDSVYKNLLLLEFQKYWMNMMNLFRLTKQGYEPSWCLNW